MPPRHATLAHVVRMSKRAGREFLSEGGKETCGVERSDCVSVPVTALGRDEWAQTASSMLRKRSKRYAES